MIKRNHWKIYFWMNFLRMLLINVKLVGEKLSQQQRFMVFQYLALALVKFLDCED